MHDKHACVIPLTTVVSNIIILCNYKFGVGSLLLILLRVGILTFT